MAPGRRPAVCDYVSFGLEPVIRQLRSGTLSNVVRPRSVWRDKPAVGANFQRSGSSLIAAVEAMSASCQERSLIESDAALGWPLIEPNSRPVASLI